MDLRLRLLETFSAQGSDGATYRVCAHDRLAPDPTVADGSERWESTGVVEYRLQDGRLVEVDRDGTARIAGTSVTLAMPAKATAG